MFQKPDFKFFMMHRLWLLCVVLNKPTEVLDEYQLLYHLSKPMQDGRACVHLTLLELMGGIAASVPEPCSDSSLCYSMAPIF